MGQVMAYEHNKEPDPELATRTGELAMLIYSISWCFKLMFVYHSNILFVVGVAAGTILPRLAKRDRRLMASKSDVDEDAELSRIRATLRQWRVEAAQKGKPLQLPVMPFLLRNIWTGSLVMFGLLNFSTFFISTVVQVSSFNIDADNTFTLCTRLRYISVLLAYAGQWQCGYLLRSSWR